MGLLLLKVFFLLFKRQRKGAFYRSEEIKTVRKIVCDNLIEKFSLCAYRLSLLPA
jgi:hypothetical protein